MGPPCSCACSSGRMTLYFTFMISASVLLLTAGVSSGEHNYDEMLERLKNSVRDNFDKLSSKIDTIKLTQGTRTVMCTVGKLCKHDLTKLFGEHKLLKRAFQVGKESLPMWVFTRDDKIIAFPTKRDVGTYNLMFSGLYDKDVYLDIQVVERSSSSLRCPLQTDNVIVGSVIFNADLNKLGVEGRLHLLRKASNFINIDMHRAMLVEGRSINNMELFGSSVLSAGPGDVLLADEPGVTFVWRAKCGADVAGDRTIQMIKSSATDGSMKSYIGYSVVGWFVTSRGQRFRRQAPVNPKGTPVPSLGPVMPKSTRRLPMGTPSLSVTASLAPVKTIIITQSSSDHLATMTSSRQPTDMETHTSSMIVPSKSVSSATLVATSSMVMKPSMLPPPASPTTILHSSSAVVSIVAASSRLLPVVTDPSPTTPTTGKPITSPTLPVPTKKVSPKTPPVVPSNHHPTLINSIGKQVLYTNQLFYFAIDDDMFYDVEDGNTSNLALEMKVLVEGEFLDIPGALWLQYNKMRRIIYALPGTNTIGTHEFVVVATDSAGASKNDVFTVDVRQELREHNNIFNITIDTDFDQFNSRMWNRVDLLRRIATATQSSYQKLRFKDAKKGSVIFSWSNEEIEQKNCNNAEAKVYSNTIGGSEFKNDLAPEYIVVKSGSYQVKDCEDNTIGGGGNMGDGGAGHGSRWWSKIIIPIIVVIIVLLLIALICCCVYRRKRKYAPPKEDTNGYLYNKKPVIFREEFEEKPDLVCLEPLILPNERPPVSNSGYAPRTSTPDGAGSSTISTESDEKAPLTKDTPRKPPGRSPPPYNN